jgi:hypothetical protein
LSKTLPPLQLFTLPEFNTVTVVINVGTHLVTTLALLSAKRHTDFPVVVIDCSTENDEYLYFEKLQNHIDFFVVKMPLRIHGETLDILFRNINTEHILLLDSDAEITNPSFLDCDLYRKDDTFGMGFIQGPSKMLEGSMDNWQFLYYQERMFIPCVQLKRQKILEALDAGCSFAAKEVYNDFPFFPVISRILYRRFSFTFFQKHDIPFFSPFRARYNDYHKPSMIYYDTGAEVYMYLKYKCGYDFIGLPSKHHGKYFNHYHGITRRMLNKNDTNSSEYKPDEIKKRLVDVYGFNYDEFILKNPYTDQCGIKPTGVMEFQQ